ncbi:hypothetical protein N790_06825 [Arenimonas malthae CC-JY-1]|uniref:Uncharacterized protein n=1 Tax=Arenimonas malthae CC-JY-1 TaxID=1384054 RepID=A0A091BBJ9_9GAMM|nr:hypothetical protein N790_06825 [Arenimonas malthae CC-JY-1]
MLLLAAVAGPGPAGAFELHGESTGTPRLKVDILNSLLPMASAASNCQTIDSVTASVLVPPRNVETNAEGVIIKGDDVVERWVTEGCGRKIRFKVTLSFDGVGGTYFRIAAED